MWTVKNLKYKLGNFSIDIPYLDCADRKVNVIMGPSGSGKTTLLNIFLGIYQPVGWSWVIDGTEMSMLAINERQLGIVFQGNDLFPHLTAEDNIKLVMQARNNWTGFSREQLYKYQDSLSLEKCWRTKAENLSGGEKQRVALLRAIMSKPRMLLLDEPFSALDQDLKEESRALVSRVMEALDIPTILITHDSHDLEAFKGRLIQLESGRIVVS